MTHTYIIDGITCNGCVAKVKSRLLSNPDVTAAEISLENKKAVISMQRHLGVPELQESIGVGTKYVIREDVSDQSHRSMQAVPSLSWLSTYKPLLMIAAFITAVSIFTSHGSADAGMTSFMAGFFLVFSFFKLLDLAGFASSYAMYDVIARRVKAWGYIYPFVELVLGFAFLTGIFPVMTLWITIVVMGTGSIGVIQSVLSGKKIQCACLGAVFNLPMSTVTVIEDLLMAGMAGVMLLQF